MRTCRSDTTGFTLLELMLVVVIVMVLSAIALINYVETRARAGRARVVSDLRTAAVGLEAYAVDRNSYPVPTWRPRAQKVVRFLPAALTTPVAYLASLPVEFYPEGGIIGAPTYKYFTWEGKTSVEQQKMKYFGRWLLASNGPDQIWHGGSFPYDPTNGAISAGDITWRQSEHLRRNK